MSIWSKLFGRPPSPVAAVSGSTNRPKGTRRFPLSPDNRFDTERSYRLHQLLKVNAQHRDAAWYGLFWDAAWTAALCPIDPPVFLGPDDFPYLGLYVPSEQQLAEGNIDANSLINVAQAMVDQGVGIAILADADTGSPPHYVMSMGRIDCILNFDDPDGEPFEVREAEEAVDPRQATVLGNVTTITANQSIMVGAPSRTYISRAGAAGLQRHLLEHWGMADPHVCLVMAPALRPTRSLMIGRSREELMAGGMTDDDIAYQMQRLSWYLPPSRRLMLSSGDLGAGSMVSLASLT